MNFKLLKLRLIYLFSLLFTIATCLSIMTFLIVNDGMSRDVDIINYDQYLTQLEAYLITISLDYNKLELSEKVERLIYFKDTLEIIDKDDDIFWKDSSVREMLLEKVEQWIEQLKHSELKNDPERLAKLNEGIVLTINWGIIDLVGQLRYGRGKLLGEYNMQILIRIIITSLTSILLTIIQTFIYFRFRVKMDSF